MSISNSGIMILEDLTHDKLLSSLQVSKRYKALGRRAIVTMLNRKWIEDLEYAPNKFFFSLTDLGAAITQARYGINTRDGHVRGNKRHFQHTLLVGEMRHYLSKQNLKLHSESAIMMSTFRGEYARNLAHPDLYVLGQDGEPSIAIEVDRGYEIVEIHRKVEDWKSRDLKIWWVTDGQTQFSRVSRQNLKLDYLQEASAIGLKAY
jgi:hypothetical protein